MRPFLAALQFLTVFPVPIRFEADEIGRGLPLFPAVGLVAGVVSAVAAALLFGMFPPWAAAVLLVAALAAVSGGLHLDGLADTADGFLSARPRERILEIMRDSRIGTMGVLALVFVLGVKAAALGETSEGLRVRAAFLAPFAGRCMLVVALTTLPYARQEGGLASVFLAHSRPRLAIYAASALLVVGTILAGPRGMAAAAVTVAVVLLLNLWARRKIGGITGDTLGAACELAEAAVLLTLASKVSSLLLLVAAAAVVGAAGFSLRRGEEVRRATEETSEL